VPIRPIIGDAYLDDGMRGHLFNMSRKNLWRLTGYELEDLLQEGYLCYYKCRHRYVGQPPQKKPNGKMRRGLPAQNPDKAARKHFMAIVKMAFRNHIYSLASKQAMCVRETLVADLLRDDQPEVKLWDHLIPSEPELATTTTLLNTAPREVLQLLGLLLSDALDGYRRLTRRDATTGKWRRGPRETTNQRYCRLLGLPSNYDIVGQVERHFLG
jgi:hypothetical protein